MAQPRVEPRAARSTRLREYAIRFLFGGAVTLVAAVVGRTLGPRTGGLFLAFPAILPATLTLIEREDGRRRALEDDIGAMAGGFGLIAFALTGSLVLSRLALPGSGALAAATGAWFLAAAGLLLAASGLRAITRRVRGA